MLTVKRLRELGFQIEVRHDRKYDEDVDAVSPLGGETHVTMTAPNGKTLEGHAVCSDQDNYCKREGVTYCLERAFVNFFLPKTKKAKKSAKV